MVFESMVGFAIAVLLAMVFLEYRKPKKNMERPLSWLAGGAILYLVSVAFTYWPASLGFAWPTVIPAIVELLGFIGVVVGGLWLVYEMLFE